MRRGNTVATILIISVLIAGSYLLVQTQVYPAEQDFIQRSINTFSQFVFEEPREVVEAYARDGYQTSSSYWYCNDYASPPTFDQTTGEFPGFAQSLLSGRLETLREEFPDLDIEISKPRFNLTAARGEQFVVENVVGVNVSNMSVTVREDDRVVGIDYDDHYEYSLRFWNIYQTAYDWVTEGNGGIFSVIDETMSTKQCAFYKDRCFCSTTDPEDYHEDNPCPCYEHMPSYEEEDCSTEETEDCQDFTRPDRDEIINEYGIQEDDLITIADKIGEQLTQEFEEDITCTAQASRPETDNSFVSAYIQYPGPCPIEELGGTCGIVPLNLFDTAACGARASDECFLCPQGGFKPAGRNAFNDDGVMSACIEASQDLTTECREREVDEGTEGTDTIIECLIGDHWITMGSADEHDIEDFEDLSCNPQDTLPAATIGASGSYDNAPQDWGVDQCNPLPQGADSGAVDLGGEMINQRPVSEEVKNLEEDAGGRVDGMGGWLDRRGAMNVRITCEDAGGEVDGETIEPFSAEFELRVVFRHGCDSSNARFFPMWTPAMCGIPSESTPDPCTCEQDGNPCTTHSCNENDECVVTNNDGISCPIEGEQCLEGVCMDGSCDESDPQPTVGASCGDDPSCNECNEQGECVPANEGNQCPANGNVCMQASCSDGTCEVTPVEDGTECPGGCGECECQGGLPQYSIDEPECGTVTLTGDCGETTDVQLECSGDGSSPYSCVLPDDPDVYEGSCCGGEPTDFPPCSDGGSGDCCCDGSLEVSSPDACDSS